MDDLTPIYDLQRKAREMSDIAVKVVATNSDSVLLQVELDSVGGRVVAPRAGYTFTVTDGKPHHDSGTPKVTMQDGLGSPVSGKRQQDGSVIVTPHPLAELREKAEAANVKMGDIHPDDLEGFIADAQELAERIWERYYQQFDETLGEARGRVKNSDVSCASQVLSYCGR